MTKKQKQWLKDNKFRYDQAYDNYYKCLCFKNGFILMVIYVDNEGGEDGTIYSFGDLQDRCNEKAKKEISNEKENKCNRFFISR